MWITRKINRSPGLFPAGLMENWPLWDPNEVIINQERTHRLLMTLDVKYVWQDPFLAAAVK